MPFDLSDAPPIIHDTLAFLDSIRKGLRRKSAGGRVLTPDEKREIGRKLIALGETLLREGAD